MANTQRVWILYAIMFFSFLIVQEGKAAEVHLIINAAELIQLLSFENALTSKFKYKDTLLGKGALVYVSTENEKLRIPSRLLWFDEPRPPEAVDQVFQLLRQLR